MKTIIALSIIIALWTATAYAGLLNQYDSFKDFVNGLQVKNGMFYDANASNWEHVIAGSVYDFEWNDTPIASIEAGYMVQDIAIAIANLNISSISQYKLNIPIGDFGLKIGAGAGYDFRHKEPVYGVALFGFTWGF